MAEEAQDMAAQSSGIFDLSTKKKKKKKALVLDDEEQDSSGAVDTKVGEDANVNGDADGAAGVDDAANGVDDLTLEDDTFDLGKKKKKKVSKKTLKSSIGQGDDGNEGNNDTSTSDALNDGGMDLLDELDFGMGEKKKKSSKKKKDLSAADGNEQQADPSDENNIDKKSNTTLYGANTGQPWDGRDYNYDELLGRVFRILHEHNPELGGQATKTILKPPQVLREGTKKTVFANFADLCTLMHRSNEHVLQYLMAELGTSGNLDGQSRLIIKGRFVPKDFEGVLRRYVNEYVMCNMCKSFDTQLNREQRLYILKCNNCGASRSVQAIKSGYQALIGKRSKQRAA